MIPLKLTIEGIYSYQERQSIDFAELTSNGLFGILGGVGSGKSSILEAITYALYGQTERLNQGDRRGYNMMNLKSDRLYIEFDFMNHDNKVFRATREMKRNSKNFDIVRSPVVQFYQRKDDDWIPLEHNDAESIIGLSYANFKRTIIIPQGQFKEFLDLGATDRTRMMKEIFQLHRFDLQDKVAVLNSKNKTLLDQIEGRLMEFESVNEEDINNKRKDHELLVQQLTNMAKQHEVIDEKYQHLKALRDDYQKLQKHEIDFENRQKQKPDIEAKQKHIETYERIFAKFDRLLSDLNRENKLLRELQAQSEKETVALSENENLFDKTKTSLDEILPYYNLLNVKRNEETDLELIAQIFDFRSQIETLKNRVIKGEAAVTDATKALEQSAESIINKEGEVKVLAQQKYDSKLLLDLDSWYLQNSHNVKLVEQCERNLTDKQEELKILLADVTDNKINIDGFESICNEALERLNDREIKANEQRTNFELQQKMTDYANALRDGVACPLCGSTEHPNIAGTDDVSHHLNEVAEEVGKIKKEILYWQNYRSMAQRMFDKKVELQNQIQDAENKLKTEKNAMDSHKLLFVWNGFSSDNKVEFEKKKQQSLNIEKQIDKHNTEIEKLRKEESSHRSNLEKYIKGLDKIKREEGDLNTKIDSNKSHLKVLKYENYQDNNPEDISNLLNVLKKKNDEVEKLYAALNAKVVELDKQIASQRTSINNLNERIEKSKTELSVLNIEVGKQLTNEGFENISNVEDILASKMDVAKVREEINQFTLQYEIIRNQISDLKIKLEAASYDDSQFAKQEEAWNASKQRLAEANNMVVTLKSELERVAQLYEEKLKLMAEQDKLSKRAENLRTMFNLFKAQGFVQYVSSIYLAQLCDHANERFRRMTRNQLRLQINENNEFEIVDYLNEGRTRSVKTLSGGQSFQVSLSLALALAESVQTNAKADKNFFFIDEGFGTQDLESVSIVFETLLNLNKENKIVGIISHVEELKERIPMTLTVVKDGERGSLIRC